jgi:hypothetical protein
MININSIESIRTLYEESKQCDSAIFAEMRTNVLLRNGKHYSNNTRKVIDNLRNKGVVDNKQKIRITKNHMHRITNDYTNSILSKNPSVACKPFNESDMADIKDAQLSNAVVQNIRIKNNWKKKRRSFVSDMTSIGEAYAILRFDYDKGTTVTDPLTGMPKSLGEFVIEKCFGFDLKRDAMATSWDDCRFVFRDKLVDTKEAEAIVGKLSPENVKAITENNYESSMVTSFDMNNCSYSSEAGKVHFIETFVRPCTEYGEGKYVLSTKDFIIFQMDLPIGIFPVYQLGFDEVATSPRCTSIINVARPYQAEINRASSKQAEHQITLGDDKLITKNTSKIANGGKLHGVRMIKVDGEDPKIMPGRTGEQYVNYIQGEIRQMYEAVNLPHLLSDAKQSEAGDPYALLHKTMSQKGIYVNYSEQYEDFEKAIFTDAIKLAKVYYTDEHIIKVVGKKEQVNIEEFKRSDDAGFDIVVEESNGDLETRYGKLLTITNVLQYAGSRLTPEQLGQLIKELPYANKERIFNSLTSNIDLVENIILALDRGETPTLPKYGNLDVILSALTNRTVQADFQFLPQQTQQAYQQYIKQVEMTKANQQLQAQQAQQGLIPAGGFLTTVNASVKNPETGKVERIKLPSDAVSWLYGKLSQQGAYVNQMNEHGGAVQADMAQFTQPQAATAGAQPQGAQYAI